MEETLLLTGFEPFGKWNLNPSWEIARALDGENLSGLRIVSRNIPVNWAQSWPSLLQAIEETNPRFILLLGLAGRRPHISVEGRAVNMCDETADNEGKTAAAVDIEPSGPEHHFSTLPAREMAAAIESLGLPVQLSDDAGKYLCNNTLYRALAWASSRENAPLVGFIHVPNLPGINPEIEGIPLDAQIDAVRAAIGAISSSRSLESHTGAASTS